nr:hypothetical protein Iba_chr15dCG0990 [Ipomoea batatas]
MTSQILKSVSRAGQIVGFSQHQGYWKACRAHLLSQSSQLFHMTEVTKATIEAHLKVIAAMVNNRPFWNKCGAIQRDSPMPTTMKTA